MNNTNVLELLVSSGLLILLLGILKSALTYVKAYIDKKTEELLANVKSKELKDAVIKAQETVWMFVNQVAEESADDLKEAAADGKLTDEEKLMLKKQVKERFYNLLDDYTLKLLKEYAGDLNVWLEAQIDTYARSTKIKTEATTITPNITICPPTK